MTYSRMITESMLAELDDSLKSVHRPILADQ